MLASAVYATVLCACLCLCGTIRSSLQRAKRTTTQTTLHLYFYILSHPSYLVWNVFKYCTQVKWSQKLAEWAITRHSCGQGIQSHCARVSHGAQSNAVDVGAERLLS